MKYIVGLLITNQIQRGLLENVAQDAVCIDGELEDREKGKYLKFNKIILLIESEVNRSNDSIYYNDRTCGSR